jgi:hypothetical protein
MLTFIQVYSLTRMKFSVVRHGEKTINREVAFRVFSHNRYSVTINLVGTGVSITSVGGITPGNLENKKY